MLKKKGETQYAKILSKLYDKIEKSSIMWIRQHLQKGIGPATLLVKDVIGNEPFLFHAGDLYIPRKNYLKNIIKVHEELNPSATIGLKKVKDPRRYGVATIKKYGKSQIKITKVVEKPKNPPTNFALTGVNVFENDIFHAIKKTKRGINGEIQLTDSIQTLIKEDHSVVGSVMSPNDPCIDIGVPETYYTALKYSFTR